MIQTLSGKVVIITGAGKGIGRATAQAYAREGANLVLFSRTMKNLDSLRREILNPNTHLFLKGNIAKESDVKSLIKKTIKRFSKIDILINNAGILTPKSHIWEVTPQEWEDALNTNLTGAFYAMKHAIPSMLNQKNGRIINVSSGVSKRAAPGWGPYAVSKAGLDNLSLLASAELANQGITVNTVNPGGTRTDMRAMAYPHEDPTILPKPEEIAKLFVWLGGEKAEGMTGQWIEYAEWKNSH